MTGEEYAPRRTGKHFPLAEFERAARADPEVIDLHYTGSLGAGTADAYSDLDIEVLVRPDAIRRRDVKARELLALLGAVQFVYSRGPGFVTGFVGPDWQRVDLYVEPAAGGHEENEHGGSDAQTPEKLRAAVEEAIDSVMYASLHNARGDHWSAATELTYRTVLLYLLLANARGHDLHSMRHTDTVLTAAEQQLVARTWPRAVEREAIRSATIGVWNWLWHVHDQCERMMGTPMGIAIDRDAARRAIEALYARETIG